MNLRQISVFVGVFEEGSFSRAAERLNATQSGLSMQIQTLETMVGVKLFERTARGVLPTYAGQRLYQRAVDILSRLDATEHEMRNIATGISGSLRLGLMPTFTRGAMAPALAAFLAEHPNVQVSVVEAYSAVLTDQVADGKLDFAIVPKATARAGVRSLYLGTDRELLVCRAGGALTHLTPVRLADIAPLKLILPARGNARREALDAYLEINRIEVASLIEMDAMIATLEFVAATDWMTVLPTTICISDLAGTVRSLHPIDQPSLTVDFAIIEPNKQALSPVATLFLDSLRAALDEINKSWASVLGVPTRG